MRLSAHAEDHEIYGDARFLEKEADHVRLLGHLAPIAAFQ